MVVISQVPVSDQFDLVNTSAGMTRFRQFDNFWLSRCSVVTVSWLLIMIFTLFFKKIFLNYKNTKKYWKYSYSTKQKNIASLRHDVTSLFLDIICRCTRDWREHAVLRPFYNLEETRAQCICPRWLFHFEGFCSFVDNCLLLNYHVFYNVLLKNKNKFFVSDAYLSRLWCLLRK